MPRPPVKQEGLFALSDEDARAVRDARSADITRSMRAPVNGADLSRSYRLAMSKAKRAWAGPANDCSIEVRLAIGFAGIDGLMDAWTWDTWKTADLGALRAKHMSAIIDMRTEAFGDPSPFQCEAALANYVEALRFAANAGLELLELSDR